MEEEKYIVASNCIFVKGYKKNLLFDIQKRCWYHITFSLSPVDLTKIDTDSIEYMVSEGILLKVPKSLESLLPPISLEYDSPYLIESAIIDRSETSEYSIEKVVHLLNSLSVKFLQVRYYSDIDIEELELLLNNLFESTIESIQLVCPYKKDLLEYIKSNNLFSRNPKLSNIIFSSCSDNIVDDYTNIAFTSEIINSSDNCGNIHPNLFSNNPKLFFKSLNFNSCLHKKVGIDEKGFLKNCPTMQNSFCHIDDASEYNIKQLETSFWSITKDQVNICKDCEFRYICTDCRVITDSPENIYSRPLKCGYNPYISKWKGEKEYYSLEECGIISDGENITIDHSRIAYINQTLSNT